MMRGALAPGSCPIRIHDSSSAGLGQGKWTVKFQKVMSGIELNGIELNGMKMEWNGMKLSRMN